MHRVLNLTSIGTDEEVLAGLKVQIRAKLESYDTHTSEVNDGHNESDQPTLAVSADFNSATEANTSHDWLKQLITTNRDQFKSARTRVHDCYHAAGENRPCEIGDVWGLE